MKEAKIAFYVRNESCNVHLENFIKEVEKGLINSKDIYVDTLDGFKEQLENMELNYSNEMVCDFIAEFVAKNTKNKDIKELLNSTFIGFIENSPGQFASAYQKFTDNSYLVTLSVELYNVIMSIGDILAVKFLGEYGYIDVNHNRFLDRLILACINKVDDLEVQNEIDKLFENNPNETLLETFDRLSNEIFEVALGFVIGHEIGHHYHYHTSNFENEKLMFFKENENLSDKIEELNERQCKELIADRFAVGFVLEFLLCYYKNKIEIHQICGFYVAMVYLAYNKNPIQDSENHPSALMRLLFMKSYIQRITNNDKELYKKVDEKLDWLCSTIKSPNWNSLWWKSDLSESN